VQLGRVDAVVLRVVLPDVLAVRDLGQDLAAIGLGGLVQDGVERCLHRVPAVALEHVREAGRAHQAGGALGVEIGGERLRHAGVAGHDLQRGLIGNSPVPQANWGHHKPLFEDTGGAGWHRTRAGSTDVVMVPEGLDERHDDALVENRDGHAKVRQVADAALGGVDVVVEEDVPLVHRVHRIVAHDGVDQGAV